MADLAFLFARPATWQLAGVPEGADALVLADLARQSGGRDILHVARDGNRLQRLIEALQFFAPGREVIGVPAWDCLPYDRLSPHADIVSQRLAALSRLSRPKPPASPARIVIVSVGALLQRVPPRDVYAQAGYRLKPGDKIGLTEFTGYLSDNGYGRSDTVMEPGEFAIRGGIIDVFPPGRTEPVRLDLFGDTLESVRSFDAMSQRTTTPLDEVTLNPVSEVLLTEDAIARFRLNYRELFGATSDDPLYESVSAGRRHPGFEHWLPLFYEKLETLFDYLPDAMVTMDHQTAEARDARLELIADYYDTRATMMQRAIKARETPDYRPLPPKQLYLDVAEWDRALQGRIAAQFWPYAVEGVEGKTIDLGGRRHEGFATARAQRDVNLFDAVAAAVHRAQSLGRRTVIAGYTQGSADRLQHLFSEHGLQGLVSIADWPAALKLPANAVGLAVLPVDNGFVLDKLELISEQDILGDRLIRPAAKRRPSERFIAEASTLAEGDLVVHREHGIGRFVGLVTLEIQYARHDCVSLVYDGGDKLFVPVENLDVLSRYGSEEAGAQLDKLGGAAWQGRAARLKQRIRDMADRLIQIAAERAVRHGEAMAPQTGLYDEFCTRFPYAETDDQLNAIADVMEDLASGRPMDRLVCGDVGFGKTEVALRAAFVAALSGFQVAVVVPTTLLARQHHRTFTARFDGFPVRVAQLSRLVSAKDAAQVKKDLAEGKVDIVVGTHALLAKSIEFQRLGLLLVDEEQHFGVAHKERLKEMRADVHVLTLTATPIPRTLQLALTGVRDMSLIATPPVDRLAVRTFVTPYDPVTVREALLREQYRGGQSFYVCPRIEDLDSVAAQLRELVPEAKFAIAHGRLPPTQLEKTMQAFIEGSYDVLLSTNIVESGLDIASANTMIIHRADMFGLAQLYQLRGRIGRSKTRAYAYLTVPPNRVLSTTAEKRLEVMQTLDTLGAGFMLASHDLDIRGAGNLLGEEQSGHIREVGIELYQQLLEEAVAAVKLGGARPESADDWSPQLSLGMEVLIPETYVADLGVRLALYRRISGLREAAEIDAFVAELIDRFGPLPPEVQNLVSTVALKLQCRAANIEKIDVGPKGAVLSFRRNEFKNPFALMALASKPDAPFRVRPDQKIVVAADWRDEQQSLPVIDGIVKLLAEMAKAPPAPPPSSAPPPPKPAAKPSFIKPPMPKTRPYRK
jgi:transcription-repair coupling factor (superfamily II helicase)